MKKISSYSFRGLVAVAAVFLVGIIVLRLLNGLYSPWNGSRLAPLIAIFNGYGLYYGPDAGPILNTIYGPIAWLAYAPALLGRGSTSALLIAEGMSVVWYFGPAAVFAAMASRKGKRIEGVSFFTIFYAFAIFSIRTPALSISSSWIHADGPALGLLLLAILALDQFLTSEGKLWCAASAFLLTSAVLTKQSLLVAVIALPLGVAYAAGRSAFVNYSFALVGSATVMLLAAFGVFGVWDMLFNMVYIPGEHGFERGLVRAGIDFLTHGWFIIIPCVGLAGFWALRGDLSRSAFVGSGDGTGPARLRMFLMVAALACLPGALLGYAKAGGSFNNFSLSLYFMGLIVVWGFADIVNFAAKRFQAEASLAGSATMVICILLLGWDAPDRLRELQAAIEVADENPHAEAERFMREHEGEIYFPELPLAGLMAEGKLYHFDYGVYDRVRADVAPADAHFFEHVPRDPKYIGFVPRLRPKERSEYVILAYFPEYTERVELEDLEGWNIYMKRSAEESSR